VTPPHIVPEWYFLPFYAILRAVPDKLAGVLAMFGAIIVLFFLPWLDSSKVRSAKFRPIYKQLFWIFLLDTLVLGYIGSKPPSDEFTLIGRLAAAYYFFHLLVLLPLLGKFEKPRPLPQSISAPVLTGGGMVAGVATAHPMETA
jgi:ubiquinol-cytochrome c reductase cytochrome b subunit